MGSDFKDFQPIIKWSGSKRYLAREILEHFPKEIDTYYEPFLGGGSVMRALICSDVKFNKIVCSDINPMLISLWNIIKYRPDDLRDSYFENKEKLSYNDNYYYEIREEFNKTKDPMKFFFLMRNSFNGLVRFNLKGEFNAPYNGKQDSVSVSSFNKLLMEWSYLINSCKIEFLEKDYIDVITGEGDFMYLDPPYANTPGMYYGTLEYEKLWIWLRGQNGRYVMSFDGKTDEKDKTYNVPTDVYDEMIYLEPKLSQFNKLRGKSNFVRESLYIKR